MKLLRALRERRLKRLGGTESVAVDPRIIAAPNRNLKEGVEEKRFREDLYCRSSLIEVGLPSLRERLTDVP